MIDIRLLRLCNQRIDGSPFEKPQDVVRWMGAVQAQDYPQAAWALGLRTRGITAADVDHALADGSILRTHLLRPTWHFVSPDDIRWLLALTGPRVKAGAAHRYRDLRLDDTVLGQASEVFARALEGGVYLTRDELGQVLEQAGIETRTPQRLVHALMHAELTGVICSGPKRGKQFTYGLLDERAPAGRVMSREEAVAELVERYFASHGPATVRDFVWWSGLTAADARAGLEAAKNSFTSERVDGRTYWLPRDGCPEPNQPRAVHLLPAFDEYTVAYADRADLLLPEHSPQPSTVMLGPVVVADGYVVGRWKRSLMKGSSAVQVSPFTALDEAERRGVAAASARYGEFLGAPAELP